MNQTIVPWLTLSPILKNRVVMNKFSRFMVIAVPCVQRCGSLRRWLNGGYARALGEWAARQRLMYATNNHSLAPN